MTMNGNHRAAGDMHAQLHALHFTTESLDALLEQITVLAADTVGADTSVGVTVIREGQPITVAASDERTRQLDEIQYGNGDGPCLHAARSGEVVTVDDSATDNRWPTYQARATDRGLRSSLSIPLELGDAATGALNLYVFDRHEFDDAERAVIGQFSDEASRAISLALRHDQITQDNDHLHTAMGTRRVIDQAVGLIMAQNRCSADEAFDILRRASQNRNVKINQLAADMIRQVTGTDPDTETHWKR
jgi:GAF domain-containing protein